MSYRQLFFISGSLLGETSRAVLLPVTGGWAAPLRALFFCVHCGEVFAKCPVVGAGGAVRPWQSFARCCGKCKAESLFEVPGSLWIPWDQDFLSSLPPPVLQYELLRHLDHFERQQ